jgi:tetratricopeptide (TPR) repeat protein
MIELVVFGLSASVVGALLWLSRRRRPQAESFESIWARRDWPRAIATLETLIPRTSDPATAGRLRVLLSYALGRLGRHEEAVRVLDGVRLDVLHRVEAAAWFNNRAYELARAGRPEESFPLLDEADTMLADEDDRDPRHDDAREAISTCILGTRGIAHFHAKRIGEAQLALTQALERGRRHPSSHERPELEAERLYWLAQIARARGDQVTRYSRLKEAAAFAQTEFGVKAKNEIERSVSGMWNV